MATPNGIDCCNTITKCLIVTTINPIWHIRRVQPGTKILQFVALKARKTSSLHTIILEKQTQMFLGLHYGFVFMFTVRIRDS